MLLLMKSREPWQTGPAMFITTIVSFVFTHMQLDLNTIITIKLIIIH